MFRIRFGLLRCVGLCWFVRCSIALLLHIFHRLIQLYTKALRANIYRSIQLGREWDVTRNNWISRVYLLSVTNECGLARSSLNIFTCLLIYIKIRTCTDIPKTDWIYFFGCVRLQQSHALTQTNGMLIEPRERATKKSGKNEKISFAVIITVYCWFLLRFYAQITNVNAPTYEYKTIILHSNETFTLFFSGNFQFHSKKFLNFLLQSNNNAQHSGWKKGKQG